MLKIFYICGRCRSINQKDSLTLADFSIEGFGIVFLLAISLFSLRCLSLWPPCFLRRSYSGTVVWPLEDDVTKSGWAGWWTGWALAWDCRSAFLFEHIVCTSSIFFKVFWTVAWMYKGDYDVMMGLNVFSVSSSLYLFQQWNHFKYRLFNQVYSNYPSLGGIFLPTHLCGIFLPTDLGGIFLPTYTDIFMSDH